MPDRTTRSVSKGESMIPVNEPVLGKSEKALLAECIDSGWISSEGPFVARFEEEMAGQVGRRYGIAVCNGSAALDVSVVALGIGRGDEVIMPAFTIISCAASVIRAGATPVLVDCDPITWNMDVRQIESKITARTRAIMAVHIYGLPVDMDPVMALAERYGLLIIEDSAEMIGQTYKGRPCSSFGDISALSFYPNKHVTTGEGGMVLTDDANLYAKCRRYRNLCFQKENRFVHEELGWNYRMTNMQAAVGIAQLERIDETVAAKRRMGNRYTELLAGLETLELPVARIGYADNIYWVYGLVLADTVAFSAKEIMQRLGCKGIGTRPFFWPMHKQPVFQKMGLFKDDVHPVAERLATRGFYLPSGIGLREQQMEQVAQTLSEVLR